MSGFMFPQEQEDPFIPEGPVQGELSATLLARSAFTLEGKRTSLGGAAERFAEERHAERKESAVLSPEEATKKYGIQGQLSFSSPVKDSVAEVLHRRKQEELEYEKIVATADGFVQKSATFTAALGSSLFDPLTLGASAIPILGEARWAALIGKYGVTRGRVIGGAIEGGVGNALMEPVLLYQAHRDQMNYSAQDSLINIGMGIGIGGGIGLLAGRWNAHVANVRTNTHLNAMKLAQAQLAAGKNVEVDTLIKASMKQEDLGKAVNMDTGDAYYTTDTDLVAGENLPPPYFSGDLEEFDIHEGWDKSIIDGPEALQIGDHVSITFKNGQVFMGTVDGVQDTTFTYEIVNVMGPGMMKEVAEPIIGETGTINFATMGVTVELHTQTPDIGEAVTPKPSKALIEDSSPMIGDGTQDQIESFLHANHEEALNWDNLVEPKNVDSDLHPGSSPGAFMRDVNTDKWYYTKYPADVEQARQEYIAYLFYKLAGVNVPEVKPIFQDGKLIGLGSKSLDDEEFSIPQSTSELIGALDLIPEKDARQFYEGVIIDAWLGNRDFTAPGNVIIVTTGQNEGVYRIDYGGSLDYRAQGGKKIGQDPANLEGFGSKVVELDSFLDHQYPMAAVLDDFVPTTDDGYISGNTAVREAAIKSGIHRLQNISDDDILSVVYSVGLNQDDASRLGSVLIARRDGILHKYGESVNPRNEKFIETFTEQQASKFLKKASKFYHVSDAAQDQLSNYKGVGYDELNKFLRSNGQGFSEMAKKQYGKAIAKMDEATAGYVFQKTTYLWRGGVPLKAFGLKEDDLSFVEDLMKKIGGQVFHDKAYMSTSLDKGFAAPWMSHGNKLVLRIQVPPGFTAAIPAAKTVKKHGDTVSEPDSEFEFVLPRNMKMQVTGAYIQKVAGNERMILNVKVVPHANVKPLTSLELLTAAKKYQEAPVIGADDEGLPEELVYSLKESMDLEDTEPLITQLDRDTNDILQIMKNQPDIPEESLKQIDEHHSTMVKQANGMTKGAFAAFNCVMKNANV